VKKLEIQFNHLSFGDGTGFASMMAVPFRINRKNPVLLDHEERLRCCGWNPQQLKP